MKKNGLFLLTTLSLGFCVLFAGCKNETTKPNIIQTGDTVSIIYDSYLQNGTIIEEGIAQDITIGLQDSFPIFDTKLLGQKIGDEISFITSDPKEGYGIFYDDSKIQEIASTIINTIGTDPKVGDQVNLGGLLNGVILEIYPTTTKVDFNEIKTRENVEFKVKVINIEKSPDIID